MVGREGTLGALYPSFKQNLYQQPAVDHSTQATSFILRHVAARGQRPGYSVRTRLSLCQERVVTNGKKRAGEVARIALGREPEIVGGFPLSPTQGTPNGNSPSACHGNKRKNETVGIAFCWETQIVRRDLPHASFTGHGILPSPAMFALYLGSVTVSMYQRLQAFRRASTGQIADFRHLPNSASPALGDHQDEGPNCGVNCRHHCVLCVRCHFAGSQFGRRTSVLVATRFRGRPCRTDRLPVMLAACQTDPSLPSITSLAVPGESPPAGPTRYAYSPRRSP